MSDKAKAIAEIVDNLTPEKRDTLLAVIVGYLAATAAKRER